jgi:hypothetical protein
VWHYSHAVILIVHMIGLGRVVVAIDEIDILGRVQTSGEARVAGNERSSLVRGIDRRRLMTVACASLVGAGALTSLTSCAATVFNPAVDGWLTQLGSAILADVVQDVTQGGLDAVLSAWTSNVSTTVNSTVSPDADGNAPTYVFYNSEALAHAVPPTVLIQLSQSQNSYDPMTDGLLACVNGGSSSVVFDAWAWQALFMFINDLTSGKSGADLAGFQALCVLSLIPSGTQPQTGVTPDGSAGWMSYVARGGNVELVWYDQGGTVQITADGIPDANGNTTVKSYTLPTQSA